MTIRVLKVIRIPAEVQVEWEKSPNTSKDSSRESLHPDDFPDKSQSEQPLSHLQEGASQPTSAEARHNRFLSLLTLLILGGGGLRTNGN